MIKVKAPAFFLGIFLLLGVAAALKPSWVYALPLLALFFLKQNWKLFFLGLCLSIAVFFTTQFRYTFPHLPEEGVKGVAEFSIDSISIQASPFNQSYLYRGKISTFQGANISFKNIPASFYIPLGKARPPASSSLKIEGRLLDKGENRYVLKPDAWSQIPHTLSLAEYRFFLKQKFSSFFKSRISSKSAASFLLSMITGDIDERKLSLEFSRVGLIHLLGVSGFQFVLLASLLGFFLRCALPRRAAPYVLMAFLTGYFFLLGPSPPVFRAWVAIMLFLISSIKNYRFSSLNALGVALMLEMILSPLNLLNIGFQLSYLCTAAILIVYPPIRKGLARLLPQRSFGAVLEMDVREQYGYIASSLIRETLALNAAVHVVSLPVLLTLFGRFPLLSLLYNLFYPFGATVAYLLSLLGIFLSVIPYVGRAILWTAGKCSEGLLAWASFPPALLDYKLEASQISLELCVLMLTLPALILWKNWREPTLFDTAPLDAPSASGNLQSNE